MRGYILRRILLVIPTLFGIMLINFALTQLVPGGPFDQIEAKLEGGGDAIEAVTGGTGEDPGADNGYVGSRGLPPEFRAKLEVEFGFARFHCPEGYEGNLLAQAKDCEKEMIPAWERFTIMMGKFLRFDFGTSYFRSASVTDLIVEKMPVSITLGLWSTLIAYLISIPLGIRKAVRDGSAFDSWTSGIIIAAYAIPGLLFAIMLLVLFAGGSYWKIFPLRGLTSPGWEQMSLVGKALDYLWHITLPVVASTISSFATLTLLTKNSFLDEVKKHKL